MLTTKIDLSGFYYRTERLEEGIATLIEDLRHRHPTLQELDVKLRRTFLGNYVARIRARTMRTSFELSHRGTDPLQCVERLFGLLQMRLEQFARMSAGTPRAPDERVLEVKERTPAVC